MAKDKERSVNPAQQQRKLEKAKALKKSKAELQARRNEKLAKRNPDRIQRQIDDLKALEAGGDIKPREKAILADLERDLKAIRKARDTLGEKAPYYSTRPQHEHQIRSGPPSNLGKRKRVHDNGLESSGSDTDDSVQNIPWPRDTPPPVPREFRRNKESRTETFGSRSYDAPSQPVEAKTTYESAPQIRDLKKEAVSKFVPSVVKRKQDALRGAAGQLLEPEELDRLEREGYIQAESAQDPAVEAMAAAKFSEYKPKSVQEMARLRAEEEAFERELGIGGADDDPTSIQGSDPMPELDQGHRGRHVQIEEIVDEEL